DRDGAWPPHLVCASLLRPPDHFTSFQRLLSHVKVVYEPGRPIEAKGYFGFEHAWVRPGLDRDEAPRPGRTPRRRGNGVAGAVAAAIEFLLASRTHAGRW